MSTALLEPKPTLPAEMCRFGCYDGSDEEMTKAQAPITKE
jgi:hypothetical protein